MDEKIRKVYYKTTTELELPENSQWRYWKFHLHDGQWKIFRGIKGASQLRDLLVKYNPQAFYYSTSEFLSCENIENPNYQIAEQLFMDSKKLVIDIDNIYGSEQVKKSARQVLLNMQAFSVFKFESIVFTGRGCRIEYLDERPRPNLSPVEKEEWMKLTRKEFCSVNLSEVVGFDDVIAWDTRRVIKGLGSPNIHNDYVATTLMSPAYIPAIPGKVNEVGEDKKSPSSSLRKNGKSPDQGLGYSPNFPMYFGKFITNKVEGTRDRFVPFFAYYKKCDYWEEDLKYIQEKFGLSTIYVMDDDFKVMALSLDAVPGPRINKVYNQSKSLTKNTWKKFKQIFIRTSGYFNMDLHRIKGYDLKPLLQLEPKQHKLFPLSKPHIDFLSFIGFNPVPYNITIGNQKNQVFKSLFEKRRFDEEEVNKDDRR